MTSKAERIRELTRDGLKPAEILEEVDTSESYVYKIRSQMNRQDSRSGGLPGDQGNESNDGSENTIPDGSENSGQLESLGESNSDDQADQLELDDGEAKTYQCGECGSAVEYLDKNCSECGQRLMWSKIA